MIQKNHTMFPFFTLDEHLSFRPKKAARGPESLRKIIISLGLGAVIRAILQVIRSHRRDTSSRFSVVRTTPMISLWLIRCKAVSSSGPFYGAFQ
jgi:hypothetical protein